MGPRWIGCLTAPQPWMSGNVNGNRLGMGGNAQNRCVRVRESTLGSPRVMGEWDGHGKPQESRWRGIGRCGQLMEGDGSPRWVVTTQKRCVVGGISVFCNTL